MHTVQQGDLIRLESPSITALVVSRDFFNRSGMAMLCPIAKEASSDALHIKISCGRISGTVLLEQLRSMDLKARHYTLLGKLDFPTIQDISDAVQGIFDYYPFGLN